MKAIEVTDENQPKTLFEATDSNLDGLLAVPVGLTLTNDTSIS
jgi:hypothetical protein